MFRTVQWPPLPAAIVAFTLSACAGFPGFDANSSRANADVETQQLLAKQAELEQDVRHLNEMIQSLEQRILSQESSIQALKAGIQAMDSGLFDLQIKSDEPKRITIIQRTAPPAKPTVEKSPANGNAQPDSSENTEYTKAYLLYKNDNFSSSIESFETFLNNFPQSDYVSLSQYWLAENHKALGHTREAIKRFSTIINSPPDTPKHADAMYQLSLVYKQQNKRKKATAMLNNLVKTHPESDMAASARDTLIIWERTR